MEIKRLTVYRENLRHAWKSPKHKFRWCGRSLTQFWHLPKRRVASVGVILVFTNTPVKGSYRLTVAKCTERFTRFSSCIHFSGHEQMPDTSSLRIVRNLLKRHDRVYVHAIKLTGHDALI